MTNFNFYRPNYESRFEKKYDGKDPKLIIHALSQRITILKKEKLVLVRALRKIEETKNMVNLTCTHCTGAGETYALNELESFLQSWRKENNNKIKEAKIKREGTRKLLNGTGHAESSYTPTFYAGGNR
tara:strand:+ start:42 stop:425 length:384 start_codon:yes stop_codon:yes gene_type:complete